MTRLFLSAEFERRFSQGPAIQANLQVSGDAFSVTALVGPSGCGKTTILRCLAGLDRPDRGQITCGTELWFDQNRHVNLTPQQRRVGYLVQEYALFPHLTLAENVAFGCRGLPRAERQSRVSDLLALLQLQGLESRYPHQISGGQQQRVALARTVAIRPRLLLLDEPLSALDVPTRRELRAELRQLLATWGIPTIVVTHDPGEVQALADAVVVLNEGRMLQHGPVAEVFTQPASAGVARILALD
ncbi:MAG: ABC transporter ATP-binding protein [Planctomycetes bacterium]|nr:ABC transporter ATP-binding protein [Planctomycetota bacterium]